MTRKKKLNKLNKPIGAVLPIGIVPNEESELLKWLEAAPDPHYFAILTGIDEDTSLKQPTSGVEEVVSLGL
ncbi:hypothetical protein GOP47_0030958, partial [Adiantum capillus-veneris]